VNELRRGFKSWCEKASAGYRRDLGLLRHAALDPRALSAHLAIEVFYPEEIPGLDAGALHHLIRVDPDSWSAVTLVVSTTTIIILNSAHPLTRQNSSLAHELAHIILRHSPTQAFFGPGGALMMKEFNASQEAEADCLAGILLVPRDALLVMLNQMDEPSLASYFGVSLDLFKMRKNLTGVERQLGNRFAQRRSSSRAAS
jgi:Zn-dependent peptidase ImmA (M78 family)